MINVKVYPLLLGHDLEPSIVFPVEDANWHSPFSLYQEEHMHVEIVGFGVFALLQGCSILAWHLPISQMLDHRLDSCFVGSYLSGASKAEVEQLSRVVRMSLKHPLS